MLAKLKALLIKFRTVATVVAGFAAQVVALGVLNGTALHVVQAVLAVATVVGAHAAQVTSVKAAAK